MLLILICCCSASVGANDELAVYQNGQVKQMTGDRYEVLIPEERIRIRLAPSLNSIQIGLLTEENRDLYIYKPYRYPILQPSIKCWTQAV
jgi:hypothetical protein